MRRDIFQAIADPTRRAILLSLKEENKNVNSLAEQFEMSRQAVSLHIKYLQECNVISIQKEGRQRMCQLKVEELTKIDEWLKPFKELWNQRFSQLDELLVDMKTNDKNE